MSPLRILLVTKQFKRQGLTLPFGPIDLFPEEPQDVLMANSGGTVRRMERGLMKSIVCAVLLCLSSGVAFADFQIKGSTSGSFSIGSVPLGDNLFGLDFDGSTFGPTNLGPPSGTEINLGTFNLSSVFAYFDPFDFRLKVDFEAPAGAGGTTFSAELSGYVWFFNGAASVNFDNEPVHFTFSNSTGSGSFDLAIKSDVYIPNFQSRSITGVISNAVYNGPSVSVPEPFTVSVLMLNLLALGIFAMAIRRYSF